MAGLTRRAVILGKVQTAEGVDPIPSPFLNAILVNDLTYTVNGQIVERNALRDSLSRIPHRMGRVTMEANFSFELKAGYAAGVRPEWAPLMRAGGYQETLTGTTLSIRSATYKWTQSPSLGVGIYYVDLTAGGDPSLANPSTVRENGEAMTRSGTTPAATMKPGQFAYGNVDSLAFSTVYVKLTDATDPDAKALGYVEHVLGTNAVYNFRDTGHEFTTLYIYPDGLLIKMVDCIIDWSMTFQAGQVPTVQCKASSKYVTPTDVAIPSVVNYQPQLPPLAESMLFTIGGFSTGVLPTLSVQSGTQIAQRDDLNSPLGLKGTRYAGRAVTGSMTIEQELAATYNFFQKFDTSAEQVVSYKVGTTPQLVTFNAPNVQFGNIASADLNGLRAWTIPLLLNEDLATSQKELKITCS